MYKIEGASSFLRDPEDIKNILLKFNVKVIYKKDTLIFPDINGSDIILSENKRIEIDCNTREYNLDLQSFCETIPTIMLDHKERNENTEDLFSTLDDILKIYDLKLVNLNDHSDSTTDFITTISSKTHEEMINDSIKLQKKENVLSFKDMYEDLDYIKDSLNMSDIKTIIMHNLKENKVNYELLKEFLEDINPEMQYKLIEKDGKTVILRQNYED